MRNETGAKPINRHVPGLAHGEDWDLKILHAPLRRILIYLNPQKRFRMGCGEKWRSGPESNRRIRICNPPHNYSATGPRSGHILLAVEMRGVSPGAAEGSSDAVSLV